VKHCVLYENLVVGLKYVCFVSLKVAISQSLWIATASLSFKRGERPEVLRVVVVGEVDDAVGLPHVVPEMIPEPVQGLVSLDHTTGFQPTL